MSLVPILIKNEEEKEGWANWNFLQWLGWDLQQKEEVTFPEVESEV